MGGRRGGQAEYVMVPYADWNTLPYRDSAQAMEKMLDLTMITDIFPTGYHGGIEARVGTGSTVYIAGGLAAATSAMLLGASAVIVGDPNEARRQQALGFGCEVVDPLEAFLPEQIEQILGVPEVDAAVEYVGFEARGHQDGTEQNAAVLNQAMDVTRPPAGSASPGCT
jgi:glutathione-independent formaldehyde dehydrogenase